MEKLGLNTGATIDRDLSIYRIKGKKKFMKIILTFILLFFVNPITIFAHDIPRSIHVFVALCDNVHQGIVPVPGALGNGKKPNENLYWGALYGVKTYLKKSPDWIQIKSIKNPKNNILERIIFKKKGIDIYLIADAYDGEKIKNTITQFLQSSSDIILNTIRIEEKNIGIYGNADLLAYIGHNGLMEFQLPSIQLSRTKDRKNRKDIIVLACQSRDYFEQNILSTNSNPLLLTNGLMAPEAYTLKAAIDGWAINESNEEIRLRAVKAYQKYQKTSFSGANNLFYTLKY